MSPAIKQRQSAHLCIYSFNALIAMGLLGNLFYKCLEIK